MLFSLVEVQQVTFQPQATRFPDVRYYVSLSVSKLSTSHAFVRPPQHSETINIRNADDADEKVLCVPNSTLHGLVFTLMLNQAVDVPTSSGMENITLVLHLWRCNDNASDDASVRMPPVSSAFSSLQFFASNHSGSHSTSPEKDTGRVESWELIAKGEVHAAHYGTQRVPLHIVEAEENESLHRTAEALICVRPRLLHEESDVCQTKVPSVSNLTPVPKDETEKVQSMLTPHSGDSGHHLSNEDKHDRRASSALSSSSSSSPLSSLSSSSALASPLLKNGESVEKSPKSQPSLVPAVPIHISEPESGPIERPQEEALAPGQVSELPVKLPLEEMRSGNEACSPVSLHAVEVCDAKETETTTTTVETTTTPLSKSTHSTGGAYLTEDIVWHAENEPTLRPLHAMEEKFAVIEKNEQKEDEIDTEEQPIVSPLEILPSVEPPARWLLYVDLSPWSSSPSLSAAKEEKEEGEKKELGIERESVKAISVSREDSVREWRLALYDAEQQKQCVGSPFRMGTHGWSDILVVIGDNIVSCTVVALRLEVKDSDGIWTLTEITSELLPLSTLLAASSKPNVTHESVLLRGKTEWPYIHARVYFRRVPGTYDAEWDVQFPPRCLEQEDVRMHTKKDIGGICSIALRCSVAVLQKLNPHVERDSLLPFIALTITGGCDQLLLNISKEADSFTNEAFRAPVARFDAFVHAKLDGAHPLLLLTVCSPVAPEIVYGRAVLEPVTLQHTVGHVWLPLHRDHSTDNEEELRYLKDDEWDGSDVVGWIHCSYECVFVSSNEMNEEDAGSVADRDLLQWPLLVRSPLNLPKYLVSPGLAEAHQWNRLDLSILASTGCATGEINARLLPTLQTNERCAGSIGLSLLARKTTDIHWPRSGRLVVSDETTHLIVQALCDDKNSRTCEVDIPRLASSRFWTTRAGEAWLPVLVAPFEEHARSYRGALLFRWTFSFVSCSPTAAVALSLRGNLGQWALTERTRPLGTDWLQLESLELSWLWLLHEPLHRPFLCIVAGAFVHELALFPTGPGRLTCAHATVCLPLVNHIEVRVCEYANGGGARKVLGHGDLYLSHDEARELLVYDEPRAAAVCVTSDTRDVKCGLLTAQLHAVRVTVRRESRWAWPAPPTTAALELRLGRVLTLQEQSLANTYPTGESEADQKERDRWAVAVVERKAGVAIRHASIALESNALYLRWPVALLASFPSWQPPLPLLELLLAHDGEVVGSLALDLPRCFGEAKGTEMWALHSPDAPAASSGATGFVEFHYAHNFADAVAPDPTNGTGSGATGAVLFVEVVEAQYREEWARYSVCDGVPATSLIVGVGCESWQTSTIKGFAPHFACRMAFCPDEPRDKLKVRLQVLIHSESINSDGADEVSGTAGVWIDCVDNSAACIHSGGSCWVSVYEASGMHVLMGEVRLRWLWMRGSLADRWERIAPLTIQGTPFNKDVNAKLENADAAGACVVPDEKETDFPPSAPVYVEVQVVELTAFAPLAETDTEISLYIALFSDACDGRRGDRTSPVTLHAGSQRCAWMQRCLLPSALHIHVELHLCGDTNASATGSAVARGTICVDAQSETRGLTAVPLFAIPSDAAVEAEPCAALTLAIAESSLRSAKATISTQADGSVAVDVPQLVILRLSVTAIEMNGRRGDSSWDLNVRSESPGLRTSQRTRLSLVDKEAKHTDKPKEDSEQDTLEWMAVLCVSNPCTVRLHALAGALEGIGSFTWCHGTTSGETNTLRHNVEMRSIDGTIPVGRLHAMSQVLSCSSELYDPRMVFFSRELCVEVRELIGVVRTVVVHPQRNKHHSMKSKLPVEQLFIRLQDGKWVIDSAPFPPLLIEVGRKKLHSNPNTDNKKDQENDKIEDGDGNNMPVSIEPKSALLFARDPTGPKGPVQLHLSLHLTRSKDEAKEICIGEAMFSVEDTMCDDNITATELVTRWVPIPSNILPDVEKRTQDEEDTPRRAYALVRYAWSYRVVIGSCLACVRVRSLGHTSLLRPFLCFRMRFPNGRFCRLPLHLFRSGLCLQKEGDNEFQLRDSVEPVKSSAAVWSFAFIRLPVIGPLGAQVQCIELHDQVTHDVAVHVGTYKWSDTDTETLLSNHDENASYTERERWLRFGEERDVHEVLLVSSHHIPLEDIPHQKGEGHPVVTFHWKPVSASLSLPAELSSIGASDLTVECGMHIGRSVEDGVWEWSESAMQLAVATCTSMESSNAEVHATWTEETLLGKDFAQQVDVEELRSGSVRYAVRAHIAVSRFEQADTIPLEPTAPLIALQSEPFIVNTRCLSTSGSASLSLGSESIGNFVMCWRIAYEDISLSEALCSERTQTTRGMTAWPAALLNSSTVNDNEHRVDVEKEEAKEEEGQSMKGNATQLDRYRSFPYWIVTSLDARGVSVVCDSPPPLQNCVPVMAHLAAVPRGHTKANSSTNNKNNAKRTRARRPLRSGAVYFPVAYGTASGTAPHALRINPAWHVEPNVWANPRLPLRLTLWQVVARGLAHSIGSIRLDTLLREAFAQCGGSDNAIVAATPWRQLRGCRGVTKIRLTLRMGETFAAQSQNLLRPPQEMEIPICVELRNVSMIFAAPSSHPPPSFGLVMFPAAHTSDVLYSSTRLAANGPMCAAHGFVLKRHHTRTGDSDAWLALYVMLVECRKDVEGRAEASIARKDVVRVLSATRVDLRDLVRVPNVPISHGLTLGDSSLCVTAQLCAMVARPVPLFVPSKPRSPIAMQCSADGCGEDSAFCRVGGALCSWGSQLYWVAPEGIAVWDAKALCHALPSGAVSFAVPCTCFRWDYRVKHAKCKSWLAGRLGAATWAYDPLRIMAEGGFRTRMHTISESPFIRKKSRARSYTDMFDANAVGAVQCCDVTSGTWDVLQTNGLERTHFPRRAFHSAVVMNARVWCYGGFCVTATVDGGRNEEEEEEEEKEEYKEEEDKAETESRDDVLPQLSGALTCLDVATRQWTTVEPLPHHVGRSDTSSPASAFSSSSLHSCSSSSYSPPPPLACHAAVVAGGQMYLFGGLRGTDSAQTLRPSDRLFALHAARLEWTEILRGEGEWPAARFAHAIAAVPGDTRGQFIVFGGAMRVGANEEAACARDEMLWSFYPNVKCWRRICVPLALPLTHRVLSVMAIVPLTEDPVRFTAVVAGGCQTYDVEERICAKRGSTLIPAADESDATNVVPTSSSNGEELLSRFISAVKIAPVCGTVWVPLMEDVTL